MLQRLCIGVVASVLVVTWSEMKVLTQESGEAEVKAMVRAAWERYIDAFSAARIEVIADEVYSAPSFQLGDAGASVRVTAGDTQSAFEATHARLAPERYDRSETDQAEICVINPGTALLTAYFTRYRDDGTVLSSGASAYLFASFAEGWRIVAIMGNLSAKLITCD